MNSRGTTAGYEVGHTCFIDLAEHVTLHAISPSCSEIIEEARVIRLRIIHVLHNIELVIT